MFVKRFLFFGSEAKGPAYVESQNGKVMGMPILHHKVQIQGQQPRKEAKGNPLQGEHRR